MPAPATLPANFNQWDTASPATLPADFKGFDAPETLPADFKGFDTQTPVSTPAVQPSMLDRLKGLLLSPAERTGTQFTAVPGSDSPAAQQAREDAIYSAVGQAVPQATVPALEWAQKNVNEPLNKAAGTGADIGAAGLSGLLKLPLSAGGSHIAQPVSEEPSPATSGIAKGIGSVAGGAVADPRNWPFLASGAARPLLQRVISGGFGTMMGKSAIDSAQDLHDNWDKYTPEQRAEKITAGGLSGLMSVGALTHAVAGGETSGSEVTPEVHPETSGATAPETLPPDFFDRAAPALAALEAAPVFKGEAPAGPDAQPISELLGSDSGELDAGRVAQAFPNFWEQDARPQVEAARQGLRDTAKGLVELLAPRQEEGGAMDQLLGVGVPEEALNSIMKLKGDRDQALATMDLRMSDTREAFDKMPESERVDFIDRQKAGSPQATPELNDLADFYRAADDASYRNVIEVQAADNPIWKDFTPEQKNTFVDGIKSGTIDESTPELKELADSLLAYKEGHFRVFWKTVPGQDSESFNGLGRAPLQGTKGFFKQSTLDSISDGIDRGGVPISTNPQRLFELSQADNLKWISAQRMWQAMKADGFAQYLGRGKPMPDGFTQLHDNIARVMFPAKSGEGMVEPGQWVINQSAGRILNNYLSRDYIREAPAGRFLMGVKNFTTAAELSFSPFHAIAMSLESVASEMGTGLTRGWNEGALRLDPAKMAEGAKDMALAPMAPVKLSRLGGSAIRYIKSPEDFIATTRGQDFIQRFPDAKQMIDDLFSAGGRLAMHEDYRIDTQKSFREALTSNNPIGAALRAVPALAQAIQTPLFDQFIPRLKVGRFLRDYSQLLSDHGQELADGTLTRPRLARQAWDRTENLFGELNFDNLFWNRTFKTGLQAAFRSVTWQLGNVRSLGNAATGQLREIADFAKDATSGKMPAGQRVPLPRLDPNAGWFLGMTITTAALGAVIQKTMTGTYPQDWKDFLFPKVGGVDKRGKPNRISLPTYFRTDYGIVTNPGQTARGALSSTTSRTADVATNKDWRGQQIADPTASALERSGARARYLIPMPFSIANYQRAKDQTGSGLHGLRGAFGFNNAPYDLDTTPAERMAREIVTQKIGAMTTPEQAASSQLRGRLTAEGRNQDDQFKQDLRDAIRGGAVSQRQASNIAANAKTPYLSGMVSHLGIEDTLRVWDVASPQERTTLKPMLLQKVTGTGFDNLPPSKQKIVAAQVRAALGTKKPAISIP